LYGGQEAALAALSGDRGLPKACLGPSGEDNSDLSSDSRLGGSEVPQAPFKVSGWDVAERLPLMDAERKEN